MALSKGKVESVIDRLLRYLFRARCFEVLLFPGSSQWSSNAPASHGLMSTPADHSRENCPPVSRQSYLPRVFPQLTHQPLGCSIIQLGCGRRPGLFLYAIRTHL